MCACSILNAFLQEEVVPCWVIRPPLPFALLARSCFRKRGGALLGLAVSTPFSKMLILSSKCYCTISTSSHAMTKHSLNITCESLPSYEKRWCPAGSSGGHSRPLFPPGLVARRGVVLAGSRAEHSHFTEVFLYYLNFVMCDELRTHVSCVGRKVVTALGGQHQHFA